MLRPPPCPLVPGEPLGAPSHACATSLLQRLPAGAGGPPATCQGEGRGGELPLLTGGMVGFACRLLTAADSCLLVRLYGVIY